MLVLMIVIKFTKGGWLTLVLTSGLVGLCFLIRRHYRQVAEKVALIDRILMDVSSDSVTAPRGPLDPAQPTAVLLVDRFGGTGIHVLLNIQRLFGPRFRQYVFVSVGAIDSGHFKGVDELERLRASVEQQTDHYATLIRGYGMKAETRTSLFH